MSDDTKIAYLMFGALAFYAVCATAIAITFWLDGKLKGPEQ